MKKWAIIFAFIGPAIANAQPPWANPEPAPVYVDVVIEEVLVTPETGGGTDTTRIIRQGSYDMISGSLGIAAAGLQFGRGVQDFQAGCYLGNDSLTTSLVCGGGQRLNNGWMINGSYGHDLDLDMAGWNLGFMLSIR